MAGTASAGQRRSYGFAPWLIVGNEATEIRRGRNGRSVLARHSATRRWLPARGLRRDAVLAALSLANLCLVVLLGAAAGSGTVNVPVTLVGYGAIASAFGLVIVAIRSNRTISSGSGEMSLQPLAGGPAGLPLPELSRPPSRALLTAESAIPDAVFHLTSRIQHDLRTPLNAVIGFSDIMRHEIHGPIGNERYRMYAQHIGASGRALLSATEDAIALTALMARPARTATSSSSLSDALHQAWDMNLGRRGTVRISRSAPRLDVRCDWGPLVQALARTMQLVHERADCPSALQIDWSDSCGLAAVTMTGTRGNGSVGERPAPRIGGNARSCETGEDAYPQAEDDLAFCLARALCELQGIELVLHELSCGGWQARLLMEVADRQSTLFEDRCVAA